MPNCLESWGNGGAVDRFSCTCDCRSVDWVLETRVDAGSRICFVDLGRRAFVH